MRRSQTLKTQGRPSAIMPGADDLGVLRETNDHESLEDSLRRQLQEKEKENDRLQSQIRTLQSQLAARPSLERVKELEADYKSLDLLLQGTQRENAKAMASLERSKEREKLLETELTKLAGENWQSTLEISASPAIDSARSMLHGNASMLTVSALTPQGTTTKAVDGTTDRRALLEAQLSHVDNVRLLLLGMQERSEARQAAVEKKLELAQREAKLYKDLVRENTAALPSFQA